MDDSPTIQIDKYIAIPQRKSAAGNLLPKQEKYPWSHMKPGDSFFVPGAKSCATDNRPGVKTHMTLNNARQRFPGTKWTIRAVTENGVNGVRVWRVS